MKRRIRPSTMSGLVFVIAMLVSTTSLISSQKQQLIGFNKKPDTVTEELQPYISNYFKILGIINGKLLAVILYLSKIWILEITALMHN